MKASPENSGHVVADRLVESLFHCKCCREKGIVKGWLVCPYMSKTLGSLSSGLEEAHTHVLTTVQIIVSVQRSRYVDL